ncbi:MAG: threonine synthase [Acidobacteriota bacterium]|nr:MAG: threonine synthase [Acidobacteriota bacterium]
MEHARYQGECTGTAKRVASRPYFKCINDQCGSTFSTLEKLYRCPKCADLLDIWYDFDPYETVDLKQVFRSRRLSNHPLDLSGVWRFREVLPFSEEDLRLAVTMGEGRNTLVDAPKSAAYAGVKRLRVKHLGWNPTGSFKDYGMTAAITQARKLGSKVVACASTGNTSASMAAYCARTDLQPVVFIPDGQIAYGKLSQTLDYGALTIQLQGDFDVAMQLVQELSDETDLYLMNSINPFRLEGQKTVMFDLFEQLDWEIPDRILVPGGNLGNSSSFGKALIEMKEMGFIDKVPRITIVQAAGAAPLYGTLRAGSSTLIPVEHAFTLASAIKIGSPISWKKAIRAIEISAGLCESVTEQEIADAKSVLGRDGIGCEPASATTLAGLKKMFDLGRTDGDQVSVSADEDIVAILTGHQLKDPDYTVNYNLDRLFERSKSETRLVETSGKIESTFSNAPIQMKADKDRIRELLQL